MGAQILVLTKLAGRKKPPGGIPGALGPSTPGRLHGSMPGFHQEPLDLDVKPLTGRALQQQQEMQLWEQYNRSPKGSAERKDAYRKLLNGGDHGPGYRPLLYGHFGKRYLADSRLPESAVKLELARTFRRSLDTFDPTMGYKLSTWVGNNTQKTGRFLHNYAQAGRVPEERMREIRAYREALEDLDLRLGREPSREELADRLGWDLKHVDKIKRETASELVETEGLDFGSEADAEEAAVLDLLQRTRPALDSEAQQVLDYTYGLNGKQETTDAKEIASLMGLTPSRVRTIRRKIADKVEKMR